MAQDRKKTLAEGGAFDAEMIRELASLLDETGLTEIEFETSAMRLRIARRTEQVFANFGPPQAGVVTATSANAATVVAANAVAQGQEDMTKHPGAVTSPMVGTVYTAPEPGANVFVKVGDTVTQGQTLLIVEAMKTMNPILAPRGGKIVRILIENEQPVEYGQALIIIE